MDIHSLIGAHNIANLDDFSQLASKIAGELQSGDVVLLVGNLGAGKTTFTQFLGTALGVRDAITSPTYTLVGEYAASANPDITKLVHIDLYRAASVPSAYIQEILTTAREQKAVVVVEWGELLRDEMNNRIWRISIAPGGTLDERIVTVTQSE